MKKLLVVIFFLPFFSFGQYFNSLEEALKYPENVIHLKLKRKKIKNFPLEILKLKNLKILDLSNNQIKELPLGIEKLLNLEELILNKNNIETLPNTIGNMSTLKRIDLWRNEIDTFPETISSLSNLISLDLRGILISIEKQKKIKKMLPFTKVYFDRSCNCD